MKIIGFIKNNVLLTVLLALTVVGGIGWQLSTWLFSDDFPYMFMLSEEGGADGFWFCEGQPYSAMSQAIESSYLHWLYVNGRLANIVYILLQLVPQGIVDVICGLMIGLCLYIVWRVAGNGCLLRLRTVLLMSVLLFWTMLPWYDGMQSSVYMVNYVWTSVLMLLAMRCMQKIESIDSTVEPHHSGLLIVGGALLSFLTAWMHEAFGVVLIAFMAWQFISRSCMRKKWLVLMMIGAIVGLAMAMSPGTMTRLGVTLIEDIGSYRYVVTKYLRQLWPFYVSTGVFVFTYFSIGKINGRAARKVFLTEEMPYFIASFAGVVLAIALIVMGRGLWPANLFSLLLTIKCLIAICGLKRQKSSIPNWRRTISNVVVCAFVLGYGLWLVELMNWESIFGFEQKRISEMLGNDRRHAAVYEDIHRNSDVPWWLNDMVYRSTETSTFENMTFTRSSSRTNLGPSKFVFSEVFPLKFRHKQFGDWDKIEGDNPFRGEYPLLVSDTLYVNVRADITVGEPKPNFSPAQWLQAFMRGGLEGTHVMTYNDILLPLAVETDKGMLYVYRPFQMPCTLRDRELIRVDVTQATAKPDITKAQALEYSELKGLDYVTGE